MIAAVKTNIANKAKSPTFFNFSIFLMTIKGAIIKAVKGLNNL